MTVASPSPTVTLTSRRGDRTRSFDPRSVGHLERDVWVAYYHRKWLRLLVASVLLVRAGFRMAPISTLRLAWQVLRANQVWAPYPDNDADAARRHMETFYGLLVAHSDLQLDPREAARLEVEWWRVHRVLQRTPASGYTEEDLASALADLYVYVYQADRAQVMAAAEGRAAAMVLSDRWVEEGCPPDSPYLEAEAASLVRSYASLLAAVHR
jgi:hypothetical protein